MDPLTDAGIAILVLSGSAQVSVTAVQVTTVVTVEVLVTHAPHLNITEVVLESE